ncbi:MAG: hypothetical protein JO277_02110 [Candidatus Eremiobacteraeota bacterium]|nr:hypothetical protein [Candidatus Eremiobacteraeota bacterium]
MWRFYLAAALLVAVFIFAVTLRQAGPPDVRISATASGTPSASRTQGPQSGASGNVALRADAPWALSALPDCARQHLEARGTAAHVQAMIPKNARAVRGHLDAGPCALDVTEDGIEVTRGHDRLRIPPPARLLYADDRYYLYEEERKGAVLRVYSFSK